MDICFNISENEISEDESKDDSEYDIEDGDIHATDLQPLYRPHDDIGTSASSEKVRILKYDPLVMDIIYTAIDILIFLLSFIPSYHI